MKRGNKKSQPDKKLQKAYNNYSFLNSHAARPIRILAEMIEPSARFQKYNIKNTIVFFGSSCIYPQKESLRILSDIKNKIRQAQTPSGQLKLKYEQAERGVIMSGYYEDAVALSEKLTRWFNEPRNAHKGFIICTGGGPGIMEAANRGAKKAKGKSIGLNISLPKEQTPNPYQTKELSFEFHYFFIRKFWFFYLAKALIVFPGGFGTLDELFELLTLVQTNKSKKYMPIILYGRKYWEKVINFNEMAGWGTISQKDLTLFKIFDDVDDAFHYLKRELTKHYL